MLVSCGELSDGESPTHKCKIVARSLPLVDKRKPCDKSSTTHRAVNPVISALALHVCRWFETQAQAAIFQQRKESNQRLSSQGEFLNCCRQQHQEKSSVVPIKSKRSRETPEPTISWAKVWGTSNKAGRVPWETQTFEPRPETSPAGQSVQGGVPVLLNVLVVQRPFRGFRHGADEQSRFWLLEASFGVTNAVESSDVPR